MSVPDIDLWVCDTCERIASCAEAQEHEIESGHAVRQLSPEEAAAVQGVWVEEGRDPRDGRFDVGIVGAMLSETGRRLARSISSRLPGAGSES